MRGGSGLAWAVLSGATFATSGVFGSALIDGGWSPAAAVTARVAIAALVLTVPSVRALRGRWRLLRASTATILAYGLVAVAVCQLCYFQALEHLSVGVALLLEYLGIVLIVGWLWARHGRRPRRLTMLGSLGALAGLVLVLDVTGGAHVDPVGVLWGLAAAVGLAVYYVLSARADEQLPPIVLAWGGLTVGAVALGLLGAAGAVPMHARFGSLAFVHHRVSWVVPVLGLALIAAVVAYSAGIMAARRLGATLASFLGLGEVLFAVLFAWWFLGQLPTGSQLGGGALIVAGVALVRWDELRREAPLVAEPLVLER